jgi:hypothetical protein
MPEVKQRAALRILSDLPEQSTMREMSFRGPTPLDSAPQTVSHLVTRSANGVPVLSGWPVPLPNVCRPDWPTVSLAVVLAFGFGYSLTLGPVLT